jgi:hypothetical protein
MMTVEQRPTGVFRHVADEHSSPSELPFKVGQPKISVKAGGIGR